MRFEGRTELKAEIRPPAWSAKRSLYWPFIDSPTEPNSNLL
jgi:hypothetical protein